jgi:hypothetical protein
MSTTAAELRRRAWRERGILTIEIDMVENAWERQVLVNLGSRLYGARGQEHAQPRPQAR